MTVFNLTKSYSIYGLFIRLLVDFIFEYYLRG